MILYFADRKMNILGNASTGLPEGFMILEDTKTEEVDTGISSFECRIAYDRKNYVHAEAMAEVGNYILRSHEGERDFFTILDVEIDTESHSIYMYAEDAGLDLLNEIVGKYEATEPHSAAWYVQYFTQDTGFEIGINEIPESNTRTLSWDGESTVTERLASIANSFGGCEISYSFEISELSVVRKVINIYQERGNDNGEVLMLGREIDRIVTKKSVANLATALRVTGGTPDNAEEPITLQGYAYDDGDIYVDGAVLKSRSALANWGRFAFKESTAEGHIEKLWSYDTTSQSELCSRAVTELRKICDKEVIYEADVQKLPANVRIGDRVSVVDSKSNMFFSTRILILETSVVDNRQTATLGEYIIRESGISEQLERLSQQVANVSQRGGGVEGIIISVTSSNGIIFKGSSIATVLTAHVYRAGVELTVDEIAEIGVIRW